MIYICIFIVLLLSVNFDFYSLGEKWDRLLTYSIFLILFFLSGFRFETGRDWRPYTEEFSFIPRISDVLLRGDSLKEHPFEIGYRFLSSVFKNIDDNIQLLFLFCSFVTLIFIFLSIKRYTKYKYIIFLGFFARPYFFTNFAVIRQGIALSISLYALRFLEENKKIKYILYIGIASLFHVSVLVFLINLIIRNFKIRRKIYLLIILLLVVLNYNGNLIFQLMNGFPTGSRFAIYLKTINEGATLFIFNSFYIKFITFIMLWINREELEKKVKYLNIFELLNIFGLILLILFFPFGEMFNRIIMYYEIPTLICLSYLLYLENKIKRILSLFFMILYITITFILIMKHWNVDLLPYKSFFNSIF